MMRPTEPPVWLLPQRRFRVLWSEPRSSQDLPYAKVVTYRDHSNLQPIRLEDMLNGKHLFNNELLKRLNIKTGLWNLDVTPRFSKAVELQRFHNYPYGQDMTPGGRNSLGPGSGRPEGGPPPPRPVGGGAVWGGWAAGAVLLALLVLFVRAAEKCVDKRLFKARRRRRSQEWPPANVTATNLQQQNLDLEPGALPDGAEFSPSSGRSCDLPPPYSECASNSNDVANTSVKTFNKLSAEEPPPPYSDCLVVFTNKDIPAVHIHGRETNVPQTSSDSLNSNMVESLHLIEEDRNTEEDTLTVELVFDNGRVLERTIDIESREDVPEILASIGDTVIGSGADDPDQNQPQHTVVIV